MTVQQLQRILRNYRHMGPGPFDGFNQKVYNAVSDTENVPESVFASNPELRTKYLSTSVKHHAAYHKTCSSSGCKLDIAERDVLQVQLIVLLDEMALLFETAVLRIPDILLRSGYDLAKERRGSGRVKAAIIAQVSSSEQENQQP